MFSNMILNEYVPAAILIFFTMFAYWSIIALPAIVLFLTMPPIILD